nr:hypothetical protein [Ulva partita]
MYHGQLTPASMRILFDALLLVSQAADILSALDDKCVGTSLKSLLMAANSFWSVLVAALRWRLEENTGALPSLFLRALMSCVSDGCINTLLQVAPLHHTCCSIIQISIIAEHGRGFSSIPHAKKNLAKINVK